jgi:tetratricopeptide (TPR) repeat protein
MVREALTGRQPGAGMRLLALEEANFRAAMRRAFARGGRREGVALAEVLQMFLQSAARLRERGELVTWVREQMPADGGLDDATCAAIRQHAWSRLTQGHADGAIAALEDLIERLGKEGLADGADLALQLAASHLYLGRVLDHAGQSDRALAPLQQAFAGFEGLGEAQLDNVAAALGDLANALMSLGRLNPALEAAERSLGIVLKLGHDREVAVGLGRVAAILVKQQRYPEADARYGEALAAAKAAGDLDLHGLPDQLQKILAALAEAAADLDRRT